ncbi:hypothetical protein V7S43_015984 [Phytophthora oleae]|uniref:NADP-dependent oxidoreductase domain-containing protein n=1 Tax=Phytophthora oleae TaxID=2107226 RepID=A0ABD3EX38_9STRA
MIRPRLFQAELTFQPVCTVLKLGYRHIDTAEYYNDEADIGRAVENSGVPRAGCEEIFVTSKLFTTNWGYEKALNAANEKLDLDTSCCSCAPTRPQLQG